jgi:hypothetical protein
MIGAGIASSLVHEVGHQGAALLDLVTSLRKGLKEVPAGSGVPGVAWGLWQRWISEIIADFWSVAKVGVASTTGLIGVVSLPSAFVFRINHDDPHPTPWIRVKLSSAIGKALYPHPQWDRLSRLWDSFYPTDRLDDERKALLRALEDGIPRVVEVFTTHRPKTLGHKPLAEVMKSAERQPGHLAALFKSWQEDPGRMRRAAPSLVFAVVGQARADGTVSPEDEGTLLAGLLKTWALRSALDSKAICAERGRAGNGSARAPQAEYPAQAVY